MNVKKNNNVKVSVVMSCYNSDSIKLQEAITSILHQSFQDFEFIIVDDGSENLIENVVKGISLDERIKIYRIQNSGLGSALNYGIYQSRGEYIARIDDDDVSCSDRLKKQVEYLDLHKDCSCVGTMHFDKYESKYVKHRKYPIEHKEIVKSLLSLKWGMAHTTVMFRRECFDMIGGYRIKKAGEDLDLFIQLGTVGKLANLDEYLAFYTMSYTGLSVSYSKTAESHLYAINDVINRELYPNFRKIVLKSQAILMKQVGMKPRRPYKRILLILRIFLFGKKYTFPFDLH